MNHKKRHIYLRFSASATRMSRCATARFFFLKEIRGENHPKFHRAKAHTMQKKMTLLALGKAFHWDN